MNVFERHWAQVLHYEMVAPEREDSCFHWKGGWQKNYIPRSLRLKSSELGDSRRKSSVLLESSL